MPNTSSALDIFIAEPSPRSAVLLAISDHHSGGMVDHEFVSQLRKAERQLQFLQNWRDAKLLAELHNGDENTPELQQANYRHAELRALHLLLNS